MLMIKCPNCGSENLVYKGGATYICTDCAEVTTFVVPYNDPREKIPVELIYEENKKLKELLKKIRLCINERVFMSGKTLYGRGTFDGGLLQQIDETLGDKKDEI